MTPPRISPLPKAPHGSFVPSAGIRPPHVDGLDGLHRARIAPLGRLSRPGRQAVLLHGARHIGRRPDRRDQYTAPAAALGGRTGTLLPAHRRRAGALLGAAPHGGAISASFSEITLLCPARQTQ